jgi:hypothetical protein
MWIFYLILGLWASSVVLEFLLAETDAGECGPFCSWFGCSHKG